MLLGKRPRHQIRRTTSVTSITVVDLEVDDAQEPSDALQNPSGDGGPPGVAMAPDPRDGDDGENIDMDGFGQYDHQRSFKAMVSPRSYSNMEAESTHFLTTCGLCKRRLFPGRDIYMYRGDTAFCSLECREQQMKQDEKKEKHNDPNVAATSRRQGRKASPV